MKGSGRQISDIYALLNEMSEGKSKSSMLRWYDNNIVRMIKIGKEVFKSQFAGNRERRISEEILME